MTKKRSNAVLYGMASVCFLVSACSSSNPVVLLDSEEAETPIVADQPADNPAPEAGDETTGGTADNLEPVAGEDATGGAADTPSPEAGGDTTGGATDNPAPVADEDTTGGAADTPAPEAGGDTTGGVTDNSAPTADEDATGGAADTPAPEAGGDTTGGATDTPAPTANEDTTGGTTDTNEQGQNTPAPVTGTDGLGELVPVSATGADTINGPEDDSPTATETLSLAGPFIKDPERGPGPPSAPTGITALMAAENWVEFTWAPSTDDQSVEEYEIYRDGTLIGSVRYNSSYEHDIRSWISTSFIDCNYTRYANCVTENLQPAPGASYAYSVVAIDNEGMRSAPSEEVVLSMATPSQSTVDLSQYNPVFADEFNGTALNRNNWKTSLPWGPDRIINGERQYFVNTFGSVNPVDYDPFVFTGETLQITGIKTPADQLEAAGGQPYLSGVLSSSDKFAMTYGYVEMRARLASGDGMLSTFYLFNQGFYKSRPEIDIIEYLGSRPDKAYQTYHYYDSNWVRPAVGREKHSSPTMETTAAVDLSNDFHTYGVLWEPGLVVWYIDGQEVRRLVGVRVSDEPMNIVTQLVMGSAWAGDPEPGKVPAMVEIDYIRAWQK